MKIVTVVGARPQFIKAAAGSRALRREHTEILVHTGQHYDANMSDIFFQEMGIPAPDYNLGISGGSHGQMTGRMLMALEPVLEKERPDALLVYGDTGRAWGTGLTWWGTSCTTPSSTSPTCPGSPTSWTLTESPSLCRRGFTT